MMSSTPLDLLLEREQETSKIFGHYYREKPIVGTW